MAEDIQSDSPVFGEALVYGLTDRDRAVRLIEALAEIPCCPRWIFRVNARRTRGDRFARWLGVIDGLTDDTLYYVRIIHWGSRRKNQPPVIGWSLDPRRYSGTLAARTKEAHLEYASALGLKPMRVKFDAQSIIDRHAKTARAAS